MLITSKAGTLVSFHAAQMRTICSLFMMGYMLHELSNVKSASVWVGYEKAHICDCLFRRMTYFNSLFMISIHGMGSFTELYFQLDSHCLIISTFGQQKSYENVSNETSGASCISITQVRSEEEHFWKKKRNMKTDVEKNHNVLGQHSPPITVQSVNWLLISDTEWKQMKFGSFGPMAPNTERKPFRRANRLPYRKQPTTVRLFVIYVWVWRFGVYLIFTRHNVSFSEPRLLRDLQLPF